MRVLSRFKKKKVSHVYDLRVLEDVFLKKGKIIFPYKYNVVKCQKFYSSKLTSEVTTKMLQLVKGEFKE